MSEPLSLTHQIFLLDANLQEPLDPRTKERDSRLFITDMLNKLEMFALAPFSIFDATDLRAPGWSFIQPITTSHISGHYFEKPGPSPHIHMDVYSCQAFEWRKIVECAHEHFHLLDWRGNFLLRGNGLDAPRKIWDLCGNGDTIQTEDLITRVVMAMT